jgi:hypothetical protein
MDESRNPNLTLLQSCQSHGVSRMSESSILVFLFWLGLVEDWCRASKGVKGGGEEEAI